MRIEATALTERCELTRRFLPYQEFPGKATHLLEEAASSHQPRKEAATSQSQPAGGILVTTDGVSATFARMTGLPEKRHLRYHPAGPGGDSRLLR